MSHTPGNINGYQSFFGGADALTDNESLFAFLEHSRKLLHAEGLEMAILAAELEARLSRYRPMDLVGGLNARARAKQVAKPLAQAGEALIVASRYVITSGNRFSAVYMPELEQVGSRPKPSEFRFKKPGA